MNKSNHIDTALARILNGESVAKLESQVLDFKEEARSLKETGKVLARAASCFANADGGSIVLGVRDTGSGAGAIVGTQCEPDWCRQRIHELTDPSLLVSANSLQISGRTLVVIEVPPGLDVHSADGRFFRRIGADCERMSAVEISRLTDQRLLSDWSADASGFDLNAIMPEAMLTIRRQLARSRDGELDLLPTSDTDLLAQLRLSHQTKGELTNAALVLVGNNARYWPRVRYTYRSAAGTEPGVGRTIEAPLLDAMRLTMEVITARIQTIPINLTDGTQMQIADIPQGAVREAVANALLHSDFRAYGTIVIEHSPESLRVTSPGRLPAGITPDNILTHASTPRNARLFRAAEMLGIAEERGLGIDRMYRHLIRSGHPLPQILEGQESTLVIFTRGERNRHFIRFVAMLPPHEQESVETLLTLQTLLTRRTLNAVHLSSIVQKTESEAAALLFRLASMNKPRIIERTRESLKLRLPTYRLTTEALRNLGSSVTYNRVPVDDVDRKILTHLDEYGKISNRTLQNMLDIDVYRARDVLKRLQNEGIIVRTSVQTRGRNVEYGPGPGYETLNTKRS